MRTNRIAAAVAIMLLVLLFPASGWAAHSFALGTAHGPALNTNKLAGAPAAVIGGRARLIVHVMGSRGGPVAGARVLVRHPRRHSPQFHLRTGGNGVTGASVGNGRWVIRARRPGEGRGRATVVTHSGGVVQVSITLHGARNSFHP
ncbi:MAG TPA: hypothetical protein VLI90_10450, partial [Tepidisphaeraceae bacterium]|nr:hypothetical protein [Tepidisphaeraceae bacterium]